MIRTSTALVPTALVSAVLLMGMATPSPPAPSPPPMTLEEFVTTANRVPMNPTSMLRADARRLMREGETAFKSVLGGIRADRAAGRPTVACPPERVSINTTRFLAHLNAIPAAQRRSMTVVDGVRHWTVATYPCPR